jgi:hypothetical protein
LVAGVLALGLIAVNWQSIAFGIAVAFSESRPELLSDARWGNPKSAGRFNEQFAPGTPVIDLLAWLRTNDFAIDERNKHAERLVSALPCNERIEVVWEVNSSGALKAASANVKEAGCL